MGLLDSFTGGDQNQAYDQYQNTEHKGSITHELLAGAAAFEAARAFQKHQEANGKPQSHAEAKELIAGFTGAFVDHEAETRGLDFIDKEKAKREATQQAAAQLSAGDDYVQN